MASETALWVERPLDELTEPGSPITYGVVKPGGEGEVAFIRGGDIEHGRVLVDQLRTIEADVSTQYSRTLLRGGEVLVSLVGNPGQVAVAPAELAGANIARQVGLVRLKPDVDARYISYYLQSTRGQAALGAQSRGSVQQVINLRDLKTVVVPVPPLEDQRRIASALGALDDRIESNGRLVSLALKLIRARVAGGLDARSSEIPIASMASFVNGGAYTKGASGDGRMVIRIAELNSGPGGSTVYNDLDVPDEKLARPGDILMSWSGSLGVYRWYRNEAIVNQHIFKVIPTRYPAWLVFDRLEGAMPTFQGIARDKATTMGHIQRGHLTSTLVEVPPADLVRELDRELSPLWERLLLAECETERLTILRGSLLSGLISGRIRVSGARDAAEIPS